MILEFEYVSLILVPSSGLWFSVKTLIVYTPRLLKRSLAFTGVNENVFPSESDTVVLVNFSFPGPFMDASSITLSESVTVPEIINLSVTLNSVLSISTESTYA